jgi:uncharacterized membrane protein (UPF0127 family)
MKRVFFSFFILGVCLKIAFELPQMKLWVDHHKLIVEVAKTPREQEKGLMDRHHLAWDHGMLFVFKNDEIRYFWMKDTFIPLDIAFLDSHGKILVIKSMKPLDLTPVSSEKPCRYALEVHQGYFKKIHANVGDKVLGIK